MFFSLTIYIFLSSSHKIVHIVSKISETLYIYDEQILCKGATDISVLPDFIIFVRHHIAHNDIQ